MNSGIFPIDPGLGLIGSVTLTSIPLKGAVCTFPSTLIWIVVLGRDLPERNLGRVFWTFFEIFSHILISGEFI